VIDRFRVGEGKVGATDALVEEGISGKEQGRGIEGRSPFGMTGCGDDFEGVVQNVDFIAFFDPDVYRNVFVERIVFRVFLEPDRILFWCVDGCLRIILELADAAGVIEVAMRDVDSFQDKVMVVQKGYDPIVFIPGIDDKSPIFFMQDVAVAIEVSQSDTFDLQGDRLLFYSLYHASPAGVLVLKHVFMAISEWLLCIACAMQSCHHHLEAILVDKKQQT
jgi:hypothetical protein